MVADSSKLYYPCKRFINICIDFCEVPFALLNGRGVAACGVVAQKAGKVDVRYDVRQCLCRHTGMKISGHDVGACVELMWIRHSDKCYAFFGLHGSDFFCDFERGGFDIIRYIAMHDIICCRDSCYFLRHLVKGHCSG